MLSVKHVGVLLLTRLEKRTLVSGHMHVALSTCQITESKLVAANHDINHSHEAKLARFHSGFAKYSR